MTPADLDKRAELTVWPSRSLGRSAQGRPFATLREALAAAAQEIAAEDAQPWIITEAGDVLSPRWIRANTESYALQ
ncbi:hypothetical protein [Methylobacterium sp. ARG-1]|uniref:hypothetical protein n=1 Tax=Methylobacterium sp. ARG-1 TaxID=1692501 RepID=UPI0006819794|nr:hypothetical protein [Methylobacterium sp. ARG-1]KNY24653.1 hypothetical protein AKJ13_01530 [Methylobacterium sp. ARG-1]